MNIAQKIMLAAAAMALLFLCFLIIYSKNGLLDLQELTRKNEGMIRENARIEMENRALFRKVERLKTDDRYIETVARDELGMIGSDEVIYILRSEGRGAE